MKTFTQTLTLKWPEHIALLLFDMITEMVSTNW